MKFKIEDDEGKIVKNIRFPKKLAKIIKEEAENNQVSFSKFVVLACIYAIENIEENN